MVYISCNPETLAKNLNAVADTHDIARFAVFDQVGLGGGGTCARHELGGCDSLEQTLRPAL